ncbi:NYN domain-containing protein [Marinilactibacillus sp. XAAS-LB27]|uniref:NYN domain-containing protein n=1 Tax=Marinilactibacillus sp. XAAS-LB27 TaxID=3114538 RepID=UPI002E18C565|nr:NYN domain-containing protein [Marinilactibacillus sp. XAAS-LB27]
MKKELLYVDGYNMIGAWPELVKLKKIDKMADARDQLLHELSNYAKYQGVEVRIIFDAQLVPGIQQRYDKYDVVVIFTSEGETADSYIERSVGEENLLITNVSVATSDLAEQWIVFQKGAARKSAIELYKELNRVKKNIALDATLYKMQQYRRNSPLKEEDEKRLKEFYQKLIQNEHPKDFL